MSDEKTESPTDKKLADARAKGDTAAAPEMRHALMLGAALLALGGIGSASLSGLAPVLVRPWAEAGTTPLDAGNAWRLAAWLMAGTGLALAPLLGLAMVAAVLTMFAAGRPSFAPARLAPQWSRLSPVAGLERLLGMRAVIEFLKTLAKLGAVITVALLTLQPRLAGLPRLVGADAASIGEAILGLGCDLVRTVAILVAAIAALDLVQQRFAWLRRLRMTRQEIKDEHKQSEGDPQIKARIRAIGMQRARRRMMAAVPQASVVVTNPTHYAVALKYDGGAMAAPVVIAKGTDEVALRIRAVAREAGVPIVESPPLARALHAAVALDRPIRPEHYAAVAEIISQIMRLARARRA